MSAPPPGTASKELTKLLAAEGLPGHTNRSHTREGRRLMKQYIKKGGGDAVSVAAAAKAGKQAADAVNERSRLITRK